MPAGSKRKPKDDEQSVASEIKAPVKNYQALMGEGEKFFRDQLYTKAIQCYTEVSNVRPDTGLNRKTNDAVHFQRHSNSTQKAGMHWSNDRIVI
jgi:hypothetical protein